MNRHSIHKSVAAILLAVCAAFPTTAWALGTQAATPAAAQPVVEGRVVSPTPLNVHYGPGTDHWVTGTVSNGMHVWITCKTYGSTVGDNNRWYQLADDQGWIPAYYANNYGYVPWCTA